MPQRIVPMIAYEDVEAGADVIRPPEEGPEGRLYTVEDLKSHRWMFEQSE